MDGATDRRSRWAGALALLAAFVWSSYYFFVLYLQSQGVGDAPMTAVPFLAGGLAYLGYVLARGLGPSLRALNRSASAFGRIAALLGMQATVLLATYGVGAVDTALLTLVGDVVLTPVLVVLIFAEGADRLRSGPFVLGILGSTAGASLAIVAGGATQSVQGAEWGVAVALPFAVATYFVWTARAGRAVPSPVLVAHATLGAAVVTFAASPLLPGGPFALGRAPVLALLLLATNGVLSFYVGPWLYFRAMELAGILLPSVLMATIPVFTLLLGILLFRSFPPWLGALGVPLAAAGAYLAFRGESRIAALAAPGP